MAEMAVAAIAQIDEGKVVPTKTVFPVTLVERGTTWKKQEFLLDNREISRIENYKSAVIAISSGFCVAADFFMQ